MPRPPGNNARAVKIDAATDGTEQRLPLEGKLAQRQLRLMRSKLQIIAISWYKIATFDLIRSGLGRTTFPSRGRLFSETFTPYFLGKDTPPVTGKPVPAPSKRGPSALS